MSKSNRTFWRNRSKGEKTRRQNPATTQSAEEEVLTLKIRLLAVAAVATGCLAAFAPAASAGEICYSISVTVNGESVVNQAQCIQTP